MKPRTKRLLDELAARLDHTRQPVAIIHHEPIVIDPGFYRVTVIPNDNKRVN